MAKRARNKTLDTIAFPRQHVRELFERMQVIEDLSEDNTRAPGALSEAKMRLWFFIHATVPFTRGCNCSISGGSATKPMIDILSKPQVFAPGHKVDGKVIKRIWAFDKKDLPEMLVLSELEKKGPCTVTTCGAASRRCSRKPRMMVPTPSR